MTLYEIAQELATFFDDENNVDYETGEINVEKLNEINMAFDNKAENLACYIKNLKSDAEQIKLEEKNLAKRRKIIENKSERLANYLENILDGKNKKFSRAEITFRKSTFIKTDDEFVEWAKQYAENLLRYKEPEADKTAIGEALKAGKQIEHAEFVERNGMTIK